MTQKFVMGSPLYRQEQEIKRKATAICGCSGLVVIRTSPSFCMNTSLGAEQSIRKNSWQDIRVTSIQMATPDTMIWERISLSWAHARRKFDEAVKSLPKGKAKDSSASQGLAYCNLWFEIEQGLSEETAQKRYEQRLEQAKPVLDAMFTWANTWIAAPKSALGKAFAYLKEQWH